MKPVMPIPFNEKEQAKLTKLPLKTVRAYNNDDRNISEVDLKKLDFLKISWQHRLSINTLPHSIDRNLNIVQIQKLQTSIQLRMCEIRYKLYDYSQQLEILEDHYSKLPLKCILIEVLLATREANMFDEEEIDRLERLVFYESNRYGFNRKLELQHRMELLRAEQKIRLQMHERLTTLLGRFN